MPNQKKNIYHLVQTNDPGKVRDYLMPCPVDDMDEGGDIRQFVLKSPPIYCVNMKGSARWTDAKRYKVIWKEVEADVMAGIITNLEGKDNVGKVPG